jgi:hypothetical protein
MAFKTGDSVRVKPGTIDRDSGTDMAGWCGRIEDIEPLDDDTTFYYIAWDSITLKNIPRETIRQNQADDVEWECVFLTGHEIECAPPRDTKADVARELARLKAED